MMNRGGPFERPDAKPEDKRGPVASVYQPQTGRQPLAGAPRGKPEKSASQPAAQMPKARSSEEPGGSKPIVGPNIWLKGVEITNCDTLVVEEGGEVEGDVTALNASPSQPASIASGASAPKPLTTSDQRH